MVKIRSLDIFNSLSTFSAAIQWRFYCSKFHLWCNRENGLMAGWWWKVVQSEFFSLFSSVCGESLTTIFTPFSHANCDILTLCCCVVLLQNVKSETLVQFAAHQRPINLPYHRKAETSNMKFTIYDPKSMLKANSNEAAWRLHTPIMHINYSQEGKCIVDVVAVVINFYHHRAQRSPPHRRVVLWIFNK